MAYPVFDGGKMELSLGPVLFEWKREDLLDFYETVAQMDVDTVYLGELVCDKRMLGAKDMASIAEGLVAAGKKVVLSSLVVVSNEVELERTRRLVELPYSIEANDMSVLNMVDTGSRELRAGPHITTYNVPSVQFLQSIGIEHVTFPVELFGGGGCLQHKAYGYQRRGLCARQGAARLFVEMLYVACARARQSRLRTRL